MVTLRQAEALFRRAGEAIAADVNDFVAGVTVNVVTSVASRTPVDEGTARSNWRTRLGSPTALVYRAYSPYFPRRQGGPGGSLSETANLSRAIEQARAAVSRRRPDQPVYITNNVPYIGELNRGSSMQAPPGAIIGGVSAGTATAVQQFRFRNLRRIF